MENKDSGTPNNDLPIIHKNIRLDRISPGVFQLRENAMHGIDGLVQSIKMKGVLQAICVTLLEDDKYEIVWGHRRYYAAKLAGLDTILCRVVDNISDEEKTVLAMMENEERKPLNPIEEAQAYKMMIDSLGFTQEKIASLSSHVRHRETVAQALQLLKLPEDIQDDLRKSKDTNVNRFTISPRHGRALLKLPSEDLQLRAYERVKEWELSVRKTEELVENMMKLQKKLVPGEEDDEPITPCYAVASYLASTLKTEVRIREFKRKTQLSISFRKLNDLVKVLQKLPKVELTESKIKEIEAQYEKEISRAMGGTTNRESLKGA